MSLETLLFKWFFLSLQWLIWLLNRWSAKHSIEPPSTIPPPDELPL